MGKTDEINCCNCEHFDHKLKDKKRCKKGFLKKDGVLISYWCDGYAELPEEEIAEQWADNGRYPDGTGNIESD